MHKQLIQVGFTALLVAITGCTEPESDEGIVARVGEYDLSVEDIANLLVSEESYPTQRDVIQQVAELWIDYTLLGDAITDDTTLAFLDFEELVRFEANQVAISELLDSVIQPDTVISDLELEEIYSAEDPELEIRASHILMRYPLQATLTQQDSVRAVLSTIRSRIEAGESFATLAAQYSQDPGSGAVGGDLGFFGRGDMVQPFEDAVLGLSPGEMTGPIETQFGLHLIRLEQRRIQNFDEIAGSLRNRIQMERSLSAESTFVASIREGAELQLTEDAYAVVRELAQNPATKFSAQAGRRPIFEYSDGELTVIEVQFFLQLQIPLVLQQITAATDEQLDELLTDLVERELLVGEAEDLDLYPGEEVLDPAIAEYREQLRSAARSLGFIQLDRAPGEATEQALSRAVFEAVADVLAGARPPINLGSLGFQLQQRTSPYVSERGVGEAMLRLGQLRANRSASIMEEASQATEPVPDSLN